MRIGFLLYPDVTQLDLTGPAQVLSRLPGAAPAYIAKSLAPVATDSGFAIAPTATFADCGHLDVLCVPGGYGCVAALEDAGLVAWVARTGTEAAWVTSVCTGSLILGAAGLLRGYRAACHWAWGHMLGAFGAEWVHDRVVVDRNRMTGGGVTAGVDFGFRLAEAVAGRAFAEELQLALEYDPQPLAGGTPGSARPDTLAAVRARIAPRLVELEPRVAAAARLSA